MPIPVPGAWRRCLPWLFCVVVGLIGDCLHAQSALDGFDPEVSGSVNAIAIYSQNAGAYANKIMIGGSFSQIQPHLLVAYYPASGLARLNTDGSVDTSFTIPTLVNPENASLPAQVTKIIAFDNGKILVGGDFQVGTGANVPKFLVLFNSDGSVDTSFAPALSGDVDGSVTALFSQATDGSQPIYVGGNFTSVSWGGNVVTGSTPSQGHGVRFLPAQGGGWSLDNNWRPNADAQIDAIAVQSDGQVLIGGAFLNVQGVPRAWLARITTAGTVDGTYNPQPNAQVNSIAVEPVPDDAIIGGWFTSVTPLQADGTYPTGPLTASYVARITSAGQLDTTFNVSAANDVQGIIIQKDGSIVLVGDLGVVSSNNSASLGTAGVARLFATGTPDGTFLPTFDQTTFAVAEMPNGELIIGGAFGSVITGHSADLIPRKGLARLNVDGTLDTNFDPDAYGGFGAIFVESDGSYLVGGSFNSIGGVSVRNLAHISATGAVDTSFEPNPDGSVQAITIDANNMIVIAGSFQNPVPVGEQYAVPFLGRMSKQGVLDLTFQPNPSQPVAALIATGTGTGTQYIVGGEFTLWTNGPNGANNSANTTTVEADYLARINNDGSVDQTFLPEPAGPVGALLIDSTGKYVIAGGQFTSFSPASTGLKSITETLEGGLGRINLSNGTVDATWNPNSEGPAADITSMALAPNGEIYIAGAFFGLYPGNSAVDPVSKSPIPTNVYYLAELQTNGNIDTSFEPQLDGPVYGVAVDTIGKTIYAAGVFKNVDDLYQPYLVRLNDDGSIDKNTKTVTGFGATLNGPATAVAMVGGSADQVLVGGAFTTVTPFGSTTVLDEGHLVRFNPDGSVDTSFNVSASSGGTINTIALTDEGLVIVAGNFTNIGGTFATDVARFWNDATYDTEFQANANGGSGVNTVVVESDGNSIYVGGQFTQLGNNNDVTTHGTGIQVANFARVNIDGSLDSSFVPPVINNTVYAANPEPNGEMVIGGSFTTITNGAPVVQETDTNGNNISFSGPSTYTPISCNGLAMLYTIGNSAGQVDTSFSPTLNAGAIVYSVVIQTNGQILIGGQFNNIDGTAVSNLARLNTNGTLDTSFTPMVTGGPVNSIALEPDGSVVIGGSFTAVGSAPESGLAIIAPSGAVSASFNVPVTGGTPTSVNAVVLENPDNGAPDSIIIGGNFTSVGGQARNNLARLIYPTGSSETAENTAPIVDPNYNPNVNGTVNTVAFDPNGKTYIGGQFTMVGTVARYGVARLTQTGQAISTITADPTYTIFTWTLAGEVPEMNSVIFQASSDGFTWSTLGAGTQNGSSNSWTVSGTNTEAIPSGGSFFVRAIGESQTTQYASESEFQEIYHFYGVPESALVSLSNVNAPLNGPFYYELGVTNETDFSASLAANSSPLPPGLELDSALGVISGFPTQAGTYNLQITLTNVTTSVTVPLTITVAPAAAPGAPQGPSAKLYDLSTLGVVGPAQNMTAGFYFTGGNMTLLMRAIGPGLANFSLPTGETPLTQPHVTLFDPHQQPIVVAEGWGGSDISSQAIIQITAMVGAFPIQPGADTSFATILQPPGGYTMQVSSGDGSTGAVLAEVYDADPNPLDEPQRLINISTLGTVGDGSTLVGGFVIGGTGTKTVIIRGVGPGLAAVGVPSNLYDPVLNIFDSKGDLVAQNSDWMVQPSLGADAPAGSAIGPAGATSTTYVAQLTADMKSVGAFALDSGSDQDELPGQSTSSTNIQYYTGYDTAVEVTLPPGSYTAVISSFTGDEGTAMVEVYELN